MAQLAEGKRMLGAGHKRKRHKLSLQFDATIDDNI